MPPIFSRKSRAGSRSILFHLTRIVEIPAGKNLDVLLLGIAFIIPLCGVRRYTKILHNQNQNPDGIKGKESFSTLQVYVGSGQGEY